LTIVAKGSHGYFFGRCLNWSKKLKNIVAIFFLPFVPFVGLAYYQGKKGYYV